jgi:hypothetical protein
VNLRLTTVACQKVSITLISAEDEQLAQRFTIVATVGDHPLRLLPPYPMPPSDLDRGKRCLCKPDFRQGGRVKVASQRNTRAIDHYHPIRALPPLRFFHCRAPFFAGSKLPHRNDSLMFNCCRSFSSLRNAHQISSQTFCSSQSYSRPQQVKGCGNSSGKYCLRPAAENPGSPFQHSAIVGARPTATGALGKFRQPGPGLLPLGPGQQPTVSRHQPSLGACCHTYAPFRENQQQPVQCLVPSFATASSVLSHKKYK